MIRTLLLGASALVLSSSFALAVTDCSFTLDEAKRVMTLDADCTTTSEPVLVPDGWTLDGDGHSITATGPAWLGAIVRSQGLTAHVRDVTVQAAALPCSCHSGNDRLRGIYFEGAGGSIRNTTVLDINQSNSCGCQEGNAIEVRSLGGPAVAVDISGNVVDGYQKTGIVVMGEVAARIQGNSVIGREPLAYIAQNGIQVSYGATGRVERNVVDGNWYTGANWAASGVIVFESSDVAVRRNELRGNQVGIYSESWGYLESDASRNVIQANHILESEWGVVIDALAVTGTSSMDAHADDNRVQGNAIVNQTVTGEVGVYLGIYEDGTSGTSATADGNIVHGNAIIGFTTPVQEDGATNSIISNNDRPYRP